jgi:hypothetical protein
MYHRIVTSLAIVAAVSLAVPQAALFAQATEHTTTTTTKTTKKATTAAVAKPAAKEPMGASMFETKKIYAGPRIWLGNLNGAVAFGGQIERGFTEPGKAGPGIITGGIGVDWYSWSFDYPFSLGSYKYSVVPIQIFSNYHYPIKNSPRLDPYAGLSLVHQIVSASWNGTGSGPSGFSASSTDFAGQFGMRYFISPKFAIQGQVGFGYGTLGLGATWKF